MDSPKRRRTSRPVHPPEYVHGLVAEALQRELPRVQAALVHAASETVASGGGAPEMAELVGLNSTTLNRTLRRTGLPKADRLTTWIRLLVAAKLFGREGFTRGDAAAEAGYSRANVFRAAVRRMLVMSAAELDQKDAFATVAAALRAEITAPERNPGLGRPRIYRIERVAPDLVLAFVAEAYGGAIPEEHASVIRAGAAVVAAGAGAGPELASGLQWPPTGLKAHLVRLRLPPATRLLIWIRLLVAAKLFDGGTDLTAVSRLAGFGSRKSFRSATRQCLPVPIAALREGECFSAAASAFRRTLERLRDQPAVARPVTVKRPSASMRPRPAREARTSWPNARRVYLAAAEVVIRRSARERRGEVRAFLADATGLPSAPPTSEERVARYRPAATAPWG
jgi:AraC-like DNA-binding protein